jgi:hypothetical protein
MSALWHLLALVVATAGGAAEVGPPPGPPAYLANARVAALWSWAQEAYAEILELRSRDGGPDTVAFPAAINMRFELVEWAGKYSDYVVHFTPIDAGPPGGPQVPDPLPPPSPQPIGLPVATPAAWGAIPGTEWITHGGPRLSAGGIGWFAPGNWIEYDVPPGKWSRVALGFGAPHSGGALIVSVGAASRTVQIPNTGGYSIPVELVVDLPIQGPARLRIAGRTPPGPGYWVGDLHALTLLP